MRTPSAYSQAVSAEVRERLEARNVTVLDLSRLTRIPRSRLYGKLGGRFAFNLDELCAIAQVLKIEPWDLLWGPLEQAASA